MVKLDFSNFLAEEIGQKGIYLSEIESHAKEAISLISEKPYKELDFINLPYQELSQIKELGKRAKDYEYFVLLGIGGVL